MMIDSSGGLVEEPCEPWRVCFDHPVQRNPLKTRAELQRAVLELTAPLRPYYSPGGALLKLDNTGTHYTPVGAWMEGFSRVLWGVVPLLAGGGETPDLDLVRRGLISGTDPDSPEYWGGDVGFADQRMVEMAAIGLALALAPDTLWKPLPDDAKVRLTAFLNQINTADPAPSNWLFFRVMVCMGLEAVGQPFDRKLLDKTLDQIDSFYLGDGWYSDGKGGMRDYYNPFAMHFYALIVAKLRGERDPERAGRYRARAVEFAGQFVHWFDEEGRAVPFGRSLTYRFAQSAFWSALAFADCEALPYGVMKGLLLRNLRWWMRQDLLSRDGILTIGYAYPNLVMSEEYNGPGSPYWALKSFLVLALPEEHPFWQAEELPLPERPPVAAQPHPGFLIQHLPGHTVALASGQFIRTGFSNFDARYAKFAYSTRFGFSVSRGEKTLAQGAFDSMLAVAEQDDLFWRVRCENYITEQSDGLLRSEWSPLPGVQIETALIPAGLWHVRVHTIETDRPICCAEGGFAIARETRYGEGMVRQDETGLYAEFEWGASAIINLEGDRTPLAVRAEANTNLMANRTLIPTLEGTLPPGRHRLVCAVYAGDGPVPPLPEGEFAAAGSA